MKHAIKIVMAIFLIGFFRFTIASNQITHNPDPHYAVIQYILAHKSLPTSVELAQSYHPPLFYLSAAPFAKWGVEKGVLWFNYFLGMINLFLLFNFINRLYPIKNRIILFVSFSLPVLLPGFTIVSHFVSNDGLAYLLGTLLCTTCFIYIKDPSFINLFWIALVEGLGLSTKGTFIAFIPLVCGIVFYVETKAIKNIQKILARLCLFIMGVSALGGYKFALNYAQVGQAILHNLDLKPAWMFGQINTIEGFKSFVNFNFIYLIKNPYFNDVIRHSIPLLYYSSFWERTILDYTVVNIDLISGRLAYLSGLIPSIVVVLGGFFSINKIIDSLRSIHKEGNWKKCLPELILISMCLSNFLAVTYLGIKYDVWSCFHARLLFPSMVCFMVFYAIGLEWLQSRNMMLYRTALWAHGFFVVSCFIGLSSELWLKHLNN